MKAKYLAFLLLVGVRPTAAGQTKPIPISVKVEAEGGGKGQGMWMQEATDLTPGELKTLERLVVEKVKKQQDAKIVPLDHKDDFIGIVVVAAKLPKGTGWHYIASSVVIVAKKGRNR